MTSNRSMMKDAITSGDTITGTGKGGRLNPEQARRFISYMTDNTAFLKDIRLEQMAAPEKQIDFLLIGSRLIRKATEALSPTELAGANITRKELRSVKEDDTKVIDIYKALQEYNLNITVYDPWANPAIVEHEYGIKVVNELPTEKFDAAIAAVAHKKFDGMDVPALLKDNHVIFDVKCTLDRSVVDGRL